MPFDVVTRNLPLLASGFALTIAISVASIIIGLAIGLPLAALRMSSIPPVRFVATAYVEVFRNTPVLVQILLIYLGLPELGIRLPPVPAAIIALSLNTGAYLAEILRGGLQGVPRAQLEAAASIALPARVTLVEVILPQAVRSVYPAITNQFILVVLASSIASIIGAAEMTQQVLFLDSRVFRTIELLIFLAAAYAVVTLVLSRLSRLVGHRLDRAFT
jgi:His/Glu/Gln/Arg/opine family amino acid ABC transporter permease subunit